MELLPRLMLPCLIVAMMSIFDQAKASDKRGFAICEREIIRAAELHAVPIAVLYAVGLTESGRKGQMTPYALNIAGVSVFPDTVEHGLRTIAIHSAKGVKLIDVGCMQINIHYHLKNFSSVVAMFDARANVEYAAKFIKSLRNMTGSWTMAVARYHAGPNNFVAQKRYVCAVIRRMVSSGVGEWTPNARVTCGA